MRRLVMGAFGAMAIALMLQAHVWAQPVLDRCDPCERGEWPPVLCYLAGCW